MSKEYERIRAKVKKEYDEKFKELDRLKKVECEKIQQESYISKLEKENELLKEKNKELMSLMDLSESDMELLRYRLDTMRTLKNTLTFSNKLLSFYGNSQLP